MYENILRLMIHVIDLFITALMQKLSENKFWDQFESYYYY